MIIAEHARVNKFTTLCRPIKGGNIEGRSSSVEELVLLLSLRLCCCCWGLIPLIGLQEARGKDPGVLWLQQSPQKLEFPPFSWCFVCSTADKKESKVKSQPPTGEKYTVNKE